MVHAYEAFMVEVGLYGNILSLDYSMVSCLAEDGTWFKNFWEFASHLDVQVELSEEYHIQPVRENDRSWMEMFLMGGFTDKKTV